MLVTGLGRTVAKSSLSVSCFPLSDPCSSPLAGNGGLFSFSGWYCNKALGTYRAWVTDPGKTVVLRYGVKTVVVSPSEPEAFVEAVVRGGNS